MSVKSRFRRATSAQTNEQLHKLIRRSAVILLLVVLGLLPWELRWFGTMHIQVYEIPPEQLNAWRVPASSSVLTVEQVLATPQAYSHRLITIRGRLFSDFEILVLSGGAEVSENIWIESAETIPFLEQLYLNKEWSEPPVLILPYNQLKDRLAWRKLSQAERFSVVTLIGQFETKASNAGKGEGGFGHLGQYTHELILEDVLIEGPTPTRQSPNR
jgi:hypothetical protein